MLHRVLGLGAWGRGSTHIEAHVLYRDRKSDTDFEPLEKIIRGNGSNDPGDLQRHLPTADR